MAKHVLDTYFAEANPLVRHHIDSFDDLMQIKIPNYIRGSNPQHLILEDNRVIDIYIGGKNGDKIKYLPPVDETGNAELPHSCRLNNTTYAIEIRADIEIEYTIESKETKIFPNILIGKIPLMLKSPLCYLSTMTSEQLYSAGECKFELGGYFVIGGAEKVLLIQERLGENMFYASKRISKPSSAPPGKSLVEKEKASKLEGATKDDKFEYIAGIRSVSEDGTKGPYSHFLMIPPENKKPDDVKTSDFSQYATNRLVTITLPGFTQPVPLISVFYALGFTSDKDIYDVTLFDVPETQRTKYDEIFMEILLSHEKFVQQEMAKEEDQSQDPNMLFLRRQVRTRSLGGVYISLYNDLFPHCEHRSESASAFYRRKGYLLGHMLRMAVDVAVGVKPKTDRDHLRYKRFITSGDLMFHEFRRAYKDVASRMLTELDSRVHYEKEAYAGKKLLELVQDENISYYWRYTTFMNELEKSFKGKWAKKYDGVAQELSRYAYVGTLAHLRRVNVDMDKGTKVIESRRIHSSSWGLLCPIDNPDGGGVGLTKSLALLCSISTASQSSKVLKILQSTPNFVLLENINPSTWNPAWTIVYMNSDMIGVVTKDTEKVHSTLLQKRRAQELDKFVSLCWSRIENEYIIFTDAGRPTRPIYREGTTESLVKHAKTWTSLEKYMDYVDAQETESIRIQMESFSEIKPSEIHAITLFSTSTSILPNSNHDPATRNAFSCQQMKQSCSWFNTAFNKRYDTIATWLNYAQRPLSQTWTYNPILGCMPYGENPIVALMVYGGYNQEDSVLVNEASLQRGMFSTTYYHSYDSTESMIDVAARTHTEFANIATNPKYRETVIRKEGYNYDKLDADGIVRQGSEIDEQTILVGIVSPNSSLDGFKDSSYTPKRGQHGIVDSVYRYVTPEGLRGVKIRVAESRVPVLGDKMSARHGQKGTVGMRIPEEDMPFTKDGIRPDMIVNPHAFPSRMTIGQFVEMMSTKAGVHIGAIADSTPFTTHNLVDEMKEILLKLGYHPYGHETMFNGQTGEMLESEIFIATTYYLRLKHMVEDKINYRSTGPKKLLTHQPTEGRAQNGSLRIGEMERDSLLSHGVSKFIEESFMDRSDGATFLFDAENGVFDARANSENITISAPYTMPLMIKELEAMHISVKTLT